MKTYAYMVMATPKPGREAEWGEWHRSQHVNDMLRVPGVVNCRRFELGPWQPKEGPHWRFMALYEIKTDDLEAVLAEVRRRFGTPDMPTTDASDAKNTVNIVWLPVSEHGFGD